MFDSVSSENFSHDFYSANFLFPNYKRVLELNLQANACTVNKAYINSFIAKTWNL